MQQAGHKQVLRGLTGLRGVGALFVVFAHYCIAFPGLGISWVPNMVENAHIWVDLFFVLSGFVMAYAYAGRSLSESGPYQRFLWQRFSRIYPMHLFILGCFLGLEAIKWFLANRGAVVETAAFTGESSVASLWANVFLLHSIGLTDQLSWNAPSWSVSAEWMAYLFFPVLRSGIYARSARGVVGIGLGCGAALLGMSFLFGSLDLTYDYGALRATLGFTIGIAAYRLHDLAVVPRLLSHPLSAPVLFAVLPLSIALGVADWVAGFLFAPLILAIAYGTGRFAGLLDCKPLRALGDASYSLYLCHGLVLLFGRRVSRVLLDDFEFAHLDSSTSMMVMGTAMAVSVVSSLALYAFVEKPSMRLLRQMDSTVIAIRNRALAVPTAGMAYIRGK